MRNSSADLRLTYSLVYSGHYLSYASMFCSACEFAAVEDEGVRQERPISRLGFSQFHSLFSLRNA